MMFINRRLIFSLLTIAVLFLASSCANRARVSAPGFVNNQRFAYLKDPKGRWIIVTSNARGLDEAIKKIQPGPASVDKLNLWIITPLGKPPAP
jgi:hypothetical protein